MKASIIIITTLAISSLCLTSCEKDSLTENITLNDSNQIKNEVIISRSSGTQFEFNEMVMLKVSDSFHESHVLESRRHASLEGERENLVRSSSHISMNGYGDSHILHWGSWYVDVALNYHQMKNTVSGTLKFTFPDMGDEVEFKVSGEPALVTNLNDNTQEIDMHLTVVQGTGRYEYKTFEGTAILSDVGNLAERVKNLSTYLVIDGMMSDTQ